MKIKNLGIVGQGFVGSAVREGMKDYYNVQTFDKFKKEDSTMSDLSALSLNSEVAFICLPTPMNKDGSCNLDILESTLSEINKASRDVEGRIVIIKSTIIPGSTDKFQLQKNNWSTIRDKKSLS